MPVHNLYTSKLSYAEFAIMKSLKIEGSPPDVKLHNLRGDLQGFWGVSIHKTSGWRLVFRFEGQEFHAVQILNYHGG